MTGYSTFRVEAWYAGCYTVIEYGLRADRVMSVARKTWADSLLYGRTYDKVTVRNEDTGCVRDTISREVGK